MITKQLLQDKFPDFKIHHVRFTDYDFYLMTNKGYSFHIDIYEDDKIKAKVFRYSDPLAVIESTSGDALVKELKIAMEYDID